MSKGDKERRGSGGVSWGDEGRKGRVEGLEERGGCGGVLLVESGEWAC